MKKYKNGNGGYGAKIWDQIQQEWLAGQISVSDMALAYGPSRQAIRKHAMKYHWPARGSLVQEVRKEIETKLVEVDSIVEGVSETETAEIVESAANRGVGVVLRHRKFIARLLGIAETTLTELEEMQLISLNLYKKRKTKAFAALVASLTRAKTEGIRTLGMVANQVIPLERQAYSLDNQDEKAQVIVYAAPDYRKPKFSGLSEDDWENQE